MAGNPNSGKSCIFNMLTGGRAHVGNYPGVTVEKKEGRCRHGDYEIVFVDLPGTYSLSAESTEELVARRFLLDKKPDVVVDVVDSSNIERNLYLATQLMEMEEPLVLAFNMSDVAEQKGLVFDIEQLSKLLETRIVRTVGNKGKGREGLLAAIVETAAEEKRQRIHKVRYGHGIEQEIERIEEAIAEKEPGLTERYNRRWLAVKLLEQDREIIGRVRSEKALRTVTAGVERIRSVFGDEPEIVIADRRYGFISGACTETIRTTVEWRHNVSDVIDAVVINRMLGLPIFLGLMYVVFFLTFTVGKYPMRWLELLIGWLGGAVGGLWPAGSESAARSLLVDGVIGGVGGVVVFLPNILILFCAISLLEASGYMARAAFVVDRVMHKIGLHGKSFIPMLIGFGCSVPAIMATRILENRRNRLTTMMIIPLMSCGARLTIYGLFIPAFFSPGWRGPMLWLIYVIGIVLAVVCAKLLRLTVLRGETIPFVMELPPYRMPTVKGVGLHTCRMGWMYLKKAGTIILGISIVLWALTSYPKASASALEGMTYEQGQAAKLEYSVIGRVGKGIEPALKSLGFDWKIGTALIGATAAKEVFVAQLGIVYSVGAPEGQERKFHLSNELQKAYSRLTGFCVMLFCLIYAPCAATVAVTRQEAGSWKWAAFQFFGLTGLAYVLTLIVYQVGSLLGA